MAGICFQCGKRLNDAVGRPIVPVERDYHGHTIKLHKVCAKTFDADKPLTAALAAHGKPND